MAIPHERSAFSQLSLPNGSCWRHPKSIWTRPDRTGEPLQSLGRRAPPGLIALTKSPWSRPISGAAVTWSSVDPTRHSRGCGGWPVATAATDARPQLAPLAGQLAQVRGDSTAARIIADHLGRLGAAAWRPGATAAGDLAAGAVLEGPLGRAELGVAWADAVPGVYDETSAQAVCGIMHVHGRRSG